MTPGTTSDRSPFFGKGKSPSNPSIASATTSKHFACSPSSAVGSVRSMPSFLESLVVEKVESDSNVDSECFCSKCGPWLEQAACQFSHCEAFQKSLENARTARIASQTGPGVKQDMEQHCCEATSIMLEDSVRHLCGHACYLRAFAPAREWHSLRRLIAELSGKPPDEYLQGWRCCLVRPARVDGESIALHEVRKRKRDEGQVRGDPLVQVVFVDNNDSRYSGAHSVLKSLGLTNKSATRGRITPRMLDAKMSQKQQGSDQKDSNAVLVTNPRSPFGLLEELFCNDPWRLLLSTILLNRTTRYQVDVVLHNVLERWPDAESLANVDESILSAVLAPTGMRHKRAAGIKRFCREWLELLKKKSNADDDASAFQLTRDDIVGLYHCSDYAFDAYKIFVQGRIDAVTTDHALQYYVEYHRGLQQISNDRK